METLTRRVPEFIGNRKKIVKILIDELFDMKLFCNLKLRFVRIVVYWELGVDGYCTRV